MTFIFKKLKTRSLPLICVMASFVLLPIFSITFNAFQNIDICCELLQTTLPYYLFNSLWLLLGTAIGVSIIGGVCAVCITFFDFPAKRFFQWALILPLAIPPYIVAFIYTDLFHYSGPVRNFLRDHILWLDAYFPPIHSLRGAIFVFSFLLYPYLYLLLRLSLSRQAVPLLEAARSLGASQKRVFFSIILPLARSAILAGLALALLEVLNDYGAVSLFSLRTLSTAIYEIWWVSGSAEDSSRIAFVMLGFILLLLVGEHYANGERKTYSNTQTKPKCLPLRGIKAALAFTLCLLPVCFGFFIPVITLIVLAFNAHAPIDSTYIRSLWNSISLALIAAIVTVSLSVVMAYIAHRSCRDVFCRMMVKISQLGYAIPGTMVAIGLVLPLAALDNWNDQLFERYFGIDLGLLLSGSFFIMILAYLIRFFAPAFAAIYSGMEKITPSMDDVARTFGKKWPFIVKYLHFPLLQGSVWAAALIVFVETVKELPATILLRPFNFDTLAVRIYEFALDEAIEQAARGSLIIVLIGLLPVLGLSHLIGRTGMENSSKASDKNTNPTKEL